MIKIFLPRYCIVYLQEKQADELQYKPQMLRSRFRIIFNGEYKTYRDIIKLVNAHLCESKKQNYDSWNTFFISETFDKLPREIQE